MSRIWFSESLETVATFWRVLRRDGVTLGFVSHDRDRWFDGVLHSAAPGMTPSAIRRSSDFEPDSAEVEGALGHAAITEADLALGRFDGARIRVGLVDWESLDRVTLYYGAIGAVTQEQGRFTAELTSRKADLLVDQVPRTSPGCRARFCGPGCALSAGRFTHEAVLTHVVTDTNAVGLTIPIAASALTGVRRMCRSTRWLPAIACAFVPAKKFRSTEPSSTERATSTSR